MCFDKNMCSKINGLLMNNSYVILVYLRKVFYIYGLIHHETVYIHHTHIKL